MQSWLALRTWPAANRQDFAKATLVLVDLAMT